MDDHPDPSRDTNKLSDFTDTVNPDELRLSRAHLVNVISEAVKRGDGACVKKLLSSGLISAVVMEMAASLLMDAISGGHVDIAMMIINNELGVIRTCCSGRSCLHMAAMAGCLDLCHLILSAGIPANVKDESGVTPVMMAASEGDPELIRLLVKYGAVVNIRNRRGQSALFRAVDKGHLDTIRTLLALGARCDLRIPGRVGNTLLHLAAKKDDPEVLRVLLEADPSLSGQSNALGQTPFDVSLISGRAESIRAFLDCGGLDLDRPHHDWTPLMRAAWRRMPDVVWIMIESGADVNTNTTREGTALHKAVEALSPEVVRILLVSGASVNATSGRGHLSPLHLAALQTPTNAVFQIILDLLRGGADVRAKDAEDRDPSRLALTDFLLPNAVLLQQSGADPDCIRTLIEHCHDNLDELVSFLCGYEFRKSVCYDPDVIEESVSILFRITHNPRSLTNICLINIRRLLRRNVHIKSRDLPVPEFLKDQVNFCDLEKMKGMFYRDEEQ